MAITTMLAHRHYCTESLTGEVQVKYAGNEIKIDGVEHLIMREDDILGIIEK
jgi:hypothetical protein